MTKLFSLFLVAAFTLALIPDTSDARCGKGRGMRSRGHGHHGHVAKKAKCHKCK